MIRRESVGLPSAGPAWKIAHVSDLHVWFLGRCLRPIDRILEAWGPDVVALTGDYADTPMGRRRVEGWLADLGARWPVAWIAGNHDRWFGRRWLERLEAIRGLHRVEVADLLLTRPDGRRCRVAGWKQACDSAGAGCPELAAHDRHVALLHDPADFRPELSAGLDLVLAGHLHGGQVVLGRDAVGRSLPGGWLYPWCGERWEVGSTTLIVSRGLGDTVPIRLRCPREVVLIELG